MADAPAVWQALQGVEDPELPLSIVEMGLIYEVAVEDGCASIAMTFTAMGCPAMAMLRDDVIEAVSAVPGIDEVQVRIVWDPPWTTARLSERARATLQVAGVGV